MRHVADATLGAIRVELVVDGALRPHLEVEAEARRAVIDGLCGVRHVRATDVVAVDGFGQRQSVDTPNGGVEYTRAGEFAEDGHHAAGAVDVLDMILLRVRGHLAEAGRLTREGVDVVHRKVHFRLVSDGQEVKHRVGRSAHSDVQPHGVEEGRTGGDAARQHGGVVVAIVAVGVLHDSPGGVAEELQAIGVRGYHRAVAGQRQSDGFVEAVHRVGRVHARTAAAGGAGVPLDGLHFGVGDGRVGRHHHRIDEVERPLAVAPRLHGSAGDEHGGDIQPHGRHKHARRDLIAIADADHGVGFVRLHHVFDAVGDEVARGQGVEHAVVPHSDAVVDGYCVELGREAAHSLNFLFH